MSRKLWLVISIIVVIVTVTMNVGAALADDGSGAKKPPDESGGPVAEFAALVKRLLAIEDEGVLTNEMTALVAAGEIGQKQADAIRAEWMKIQERLKQRQALQQVLQQMLSSKNKTDIEISPEQAARFKVQVQKMIEQAKQTAAGMRVGR